MSVYSLSVNHFHFSLMTIKIEAVDKVQQEKLFQFLSSQPRKISPLCLKTYLHSIYHILRIPFPTEEILPSPLTKSESG